MPNYLKMPKQQHVIALLELGWSYRRIEAETGVRRETVGRYDRARQANAAKAFPGSEPPGAPCRRGVARRRTIQMRPKRSPARRPNPAKVFPGSPAQTIAIRGRRVSHGDHRETRRGPEPPADLARPRRGVRLRRQLRIGEAVRPHARACGVARSASFTARPARKRKWISFAARRRSTRRPASGVGRGCFA